jgi:hypothetical protein
MLKAIHAGEDILAARQKAIQVTGKCPEFFAHLVWAERRPALA